VTDLGRGFIDQSRAYLGTDFHRKIRGALEQVSDEDIWWRPNDASNSIGHLLLHISGNLRQWVVSGLGGAPDDRTRDREFAPDHQPNRDALLDRLAGVIGEAEDVLDRLDPATLAASHTIQGREVTGLEALYHAVEHFGMHTGQILYIVKMRAGRDLGFYEVVDGIPRARWTKF
jgi:uncharacterized damage-inducible protein DinB